MGAGQGGEWLWVGGGEYAGRASTPRASPPRVSLAVYSVYTVARVSLSVYQCLIVRVSVYQCSIVRVSVYQCCLLVFVSMLPV